TWSSMHRSRCALTPPINRRALRCSHLASLSAHSLSCRPLMLGGLTPCFLKARVETPHATASCSRCRAIRILGSLADPAEYNSRPRSTRLSPTKLRWFHFAWALFDYRSSTYGPSLKCWKTARANLVRPRLSRAKRTTSPVAGSLELSGMFARRGCISRTRPLATRIRRRSSAMALSMG
ncbi:hypothetical protein LTR53_014887, partial [Teratosphaeriaceae sp. CCFEE 6253]